MTRFTSAQEHLHIRGGKEVRKHARNRANVSSSIPLLLQKASLRMVQIRGTWTHRQTLEIARSLIRRDARFGSIESVLRWIADPANDVIRMHSGDYSFHLVPSMLERLRCIASARSRTIDEFWNSKRDAVTPFCRAMGLRRIAMPADNDCQFWAMMHQLHLHGVVDYEVKTLREKQIALRADVIDWIEAHLDDDIGDVPLRMLIEACEDSVERFLHDMRRGCGERRWGNEITIVACCMRFNVFVQVIHEKGLTYCRGYSPPSGTGRTISIFYDGMGHYDSFESIARDLE